MMTHAGVITEIANFKEIDRNVERDRGNSEAIELGVASIDDLGVRDFCVDGLKKQLRQFFVSEAARAAVYKRCRY